MTNETIAENLKEEIEEALENFEELEEPFFLFVDLLEHLKTFDFIQFKSKLKQEILKDIETSKERYGHLPQELLDGFLIEHTHYFGSNSWANTYSIILEKPYLENERLSLTYKSMPEETVGPMTITLSFLNALEQLEDYQQKYTDLFNTQVFYKDIDGYDDFIDIYLNTGYLAIHEVLVELYDEKAFEQINFAEQYVFLIGQNEMDNEQVLFVHK